MVIDGAFGVFLAILIEEKKIAAATPGCLVFMICSVRSVELSW